MVLFALLAFAGNSVICRLALKQDEIDPLLFTALRLFSGAIVLIIIYALRQQFTYGQRCVVACVVFPINRQRAFAALCLCVYMLGFSYAYRTLDTGTGALILFGMVQLTLMILASLRAKTPAIVEWVGAGIAFVGLFVLVKPVLSTPSLLDFVLMSLAGIAWGGYTFVGSGSRDPIKETMHNFVLAIPLLVFAGAVFILFSPPVIIISPFGLVLAVVSGVVTSGLGYVLWYGALPHIKPSHAAVVQLSVPVLAAVGGVLFVADTLTWLLVVSACIVLGGIAVSILGRR